MTGTRAPRGRFRYAAALVVTLSWALAWPLPASAQLFPPLLPPLLPLPGGLVVTITSPSGGATVAGTITVQASVSSLGVLVRGVQFKLDGANLGGEDTGAPYSVAWDTTTTGNGLHTLTAVARDALGVRFVSEPVTITVSNAPPPAVTRFEEADPSVTYAGDWMPADPRPWSGGNAVVTQTAGAQAAFAFTGTSVNWIGWRGPFGGIARVSLDGVLVAEVDTYAQSEEVQAVVFMATSLANTSHTLTIEVTGQQNPASTGAYIAVDAFDVASP